MSDPYVGEMRLFAGNYAPQGWCPCDGRVLAIQDYQALFALIGTTYGGDGRTTFAIPDLRGRIPVGTGQLTAGGTGVYKLGQTGGATTVALSTANLPSHSHTMLAIDEPASQASPAYGMYAVPGTGFACYATYAAGAETVALNAGSIQPAGGGQPHGNLMPSMPLSWIIALTGQYPDIQS